MSADAPTPLTDAAPKAAYRDATFCELVSADFARELERRLAEAENQLRQKCGAHSFVFETAHTERDQREITSLLIALNHAESEWQAQAALVKASVEREAKASELSEVRRLSLEDLAAEKAHAEEVWQKRNGALAAQVAMLREALCEADQMFQMTVGVFGGIPKEGSPAVKITAALQSTPATASAELEELREDKARLNWLDTHEASIEVNEVDPLICRVQASDDFRAEGVSDPYNVRTAIDAARQTPTDAAMEAKP